MARREIQNLLRRYRRVWRYRRRLLHPTLIWTCAGSVWAVDFSEPPQPIEGTFDRLLAVRDLASGCQLAWLPVHDENATTAIAGLVSLFNEHGAPLVLKSDNGSAFITDQFAQFLEGWLVSHLFSPPRTPRYNGSCEAGIGSMKTRTHHQAAARNSAGEWTCDDAEAARLAANQTARPCGCKGSTPIETWQARQPITAAVRSAFSVTLIQEEQEGRNDQGYALNVKLDRNAQAAVNRVAIRNALVGQELLRFA